MDRKRFFYETIAERFDELHNEYDINRRLSVIFDELLTIDMSGLRVLDLGCGSGWFSLQAGKRGGKVFSLDISQSLAKITKERTSQNSLAADAAALPFQAHQFDIVISSEMLEHLSEPERSIEEISRVLASGGLVALTTPNRKWLWLVKLASTFKLRPYGGYENFLSFKDVANFIDMHGLRIICHYGFHPWPFQLSVLHRVSRYVDGKFSRSWWGKWMINQAVLAEKL